MNFEFAVFSESMKLSSLLYTVTGVLKQSIIGIFISVLANAFSILILRSPMIIMLMFTFQCLLSCTRHWNSQCSKIFACDKIWFLIYYKILANFPIKRCQECFRYQLFVCDVYIIYNLYIYIFIYIYIYIIICM